MKRSIDQNVVVTRIANHVCFLPVRNTKHYQAITRHIEQTKLAPSPVNGSDAAFEDDSLSGHVYQTTIHNCLCFADLRAALINEGAATTGTRVIGAPLADLGDDIEIRLGNGRTTVGMTTDDGSEVQLPASRVVEAFRSALHGPGVAPPEVLVYRTVIYTTSELGNTLRCFPVRAQRGGQIGRSISDTGENFFAVAGRSVYDLAVVTSFGRPAGKLTSFHDTCHRVASTMVTVRH